MNVSCLAVLFSALAGAGAAGQDLPTFTTEARLVEVYATVADSKGRFVEGLQRDQFTVRDNGEPQPISVFEAGSSQLACAILMDTTGSMKSELPVVKSAILRFIDNLPADAKVGVYTFANTLNTVQDFTTDRKAAKQGVLRTYAAGTTALFDAMVQVSRRLSKQSGKKFLVVFTDGDDNASLLSSTSAIARARQMGIPVYAVAQGEAVRSASLMKVLRNISADTGGLAYQVRKPADVEKVFAGVADELRHTYLIGYKAPPIESKEWRHIEVAIAGIRSASVRARQGYTP